MSKTVLYGLLAIMLALSFMGCDTEPESDFVAVTDISMPDSYVALGGFLTLNGTVTPADATNKTIKWEINPTLAEGTGAAIDSDKLTVESFGTQSIPWGRVGITATIDNGKEQGVPFTKDFSIGIDSYNADTHTLYFLAQKGTYTYDGDKIGIWQHWNGGDRKLKVTEFYDEPLEPDTVYKITISGTLDTAVTELSVEFYCWDEEDGKDIYFGSRATVDSVAIGEINEVLSYQTKSDSEFKTEYNKTAEEVIAEYGESFQVSFVAFDNNDIANDEYGKIMAQIENLSITVEKVVE